MRKPTFLLAFLTALALAAVPAHGQDAAASRTDTLRAPTFTGRTIAVALGLPGNIDNESVETLRRGLRCRLDVEDAVLCNMPLRDRRREDCAHTAVMGQFIAWFDFLGGRPEPRPVSVAIQCGETVVTLTSLTRQPTITFTLETRTGSNVESVRELVYIRTEAGR